MTLAGGRWSIPSEFFGPYLGFNVVSAALILSAIGWPRPTRVLFVLIFGAAALFNGYTAVTDPAAYQTYADTALLDLYRTFIRGSFRDHARAFVLAIAAGQLTVGALLACGGRLRRAGAVGGVVFLGAITPLGVGAAFPAPLIMAVALIVMHRRLAIRAATA